LTTLWLKKTSKKSLRINVKFRLWKVQVQTLFGQKYVKQVKYGRSCLRNIRGTQ